MMPMYCVKGQDIVDKVCQNIYYITYYILLNIGPLTYFDAHFGETNGPVIWSNLACSGWETNIYNCNKDVFPNFNCTQQNTAGVTCKDGKSTLLYHDDLTWHYKLVKMAMLNCLVENIPMKALSQYAITVYGA